MRLTARHYPLIMPHWQITTSWDDQTSLAHFDQRNPSCRLGWMTYSRSELLNQGFDEPLRSQYRGQTIEGTGNGWAISGPEITIVGGLGMHSRNHVVQFQVVRSAASGGASPM